MVTTFWNLCPELILELCDYFSINELYYSFYPDCLPYLFELLCSSHKRLHLDLPNNNLLVGIFFSLIDTNQISSIRLSSRSIPRLTLNSVRVLTLHDIKDVGRVCSQQLNLPVLERLILSHTNPFTTIALINIFARPSLKYLQIESTNAHVVFEGLGYTQFSSIEKLVLNTSCSRQTLDFFLISLPNLHSLQVRTLINTQPTVRPIGAHILIPPTIRHSSLRILNLVWYHPTMMDISTLLAGLVNLKCCKLAGTMHFQELKGQFWHGLLTKTCVNLMKMYVNMLIWTDDRAEEIKNEFDHDTFFHCLDFDLLPSKREKQLYIFFGSFQRSFE